MTTVKIDEIIRILKKEYPGWQTPIITKIANRHGQAFKILISTILSLRTKDDVTEQATKRLFILARSPRKMAKLKADKIEKAIYPAGFYRTKAIKIINICKRLVGEFGGRVPDNLDTLLTFDGVGRKTANLVITKAFQKPGICVDTHVHRISNRLGYLKTETPYHTEMELRKILPEKYWIIINDLFVAFGQNHCKPVSPFCSTCRISQYCNRIGVKHYR
ncbi:MAG: endonuclease III [bacterium]